MACARRSLATNFTLISRRFHPSVSHLLPHHDRDGDAHDADDAASSHHSSQLSPFSTSRPIASDWNRGKKGLGLFLPLGVDLSLRRYSSGAGGPCEIDYVKDVTDVVANKGADVADVLAERSVEVVQAASPAVGEVAAAAADSALPVAALQHAIDAIHNFTGLNWWGAIAVTTLLIRFATLPIMIHQLKATSKLQVLKPEIEELKAKMQNTADPRAMQENQKRFKELFKKHGISPFTPFKGMLIQGPVFISFYMAISNMVEKVPSFKEGGAFWFTDLTTPDAFYVLPIFTALSFLATVELNMQDGMQGNQMAGNMKKFSRLLALLTVPFTASFPKALFCYWVTTNFFSLAYGAVIKRPPVRKFLALPELEAPAAPASQSGFSFFGGSKQIASVASSSPLITQPSESPDRRISSSTVISQRTLEKTVQGKTKPKKKRSRR